MSENVSPEAPLTGRQQEAAALLAQGRLTREQIAAAVGVRDRTLYRWQRQPGFQARVGLFRDEYRRAVLERGIADRVARLDELNERWEKGRRVIAARAEEGRRRNELARAVERRRAAGEDLPREIAGLVPVPGYETGLLTRTLKQLGSGAAVRIVEEFAVDTGLLAELRQMEQQAAKEVGQWVDRGEVTGKNGAPIQGQHSLDLAEASEEELEILERLARRRAAARGDRAGAEPA